MRFFTEREIPSLQIDANDKLFDHSIIFYLFNYPWIDTNFEICYLLNDEWMRSKYLLDVNFKLFYFCIKNQW